MRPLLIFQAAKCVIVLAIVALSLFSCSEEKPVAPPFKGSVFMRLVASDYTSLVVSLSITGSTRKTGFILTRNGSRVVDGTMQSADTLLHDTTLIPSTNYLYRGLRIENGQVVDSSEILIARTKDTTSSEFHFEVSYFGDNESYLKDVFAISPTNVWAVGKIQVYDSTRAKNVIYNAMHFDGKSWALRQVPMNFDFGGGQILRTFNQPITSVFAPDPTEVWFISETGGACRWNGATWVEMVLKQGDGFPMNKMWGTRNNLYFVGPSGLLQHWDGAKKDKLVSGTALDINDIWGVGDTALCVASKWLFESTESEIIRLVGVEARIQNSIGLPKSMKSLWYASSSTIYSVGGFYARMEGTVWKSLPIPARGFLMSIRGNADNDLFAVSQRGDVLHYDGLHWASYPNIDPQSLNYLESVAVCGDHIFAVGWRPTGAVILHGTRY